MGHKYVMHKTTGMVGVADLPDWLNFDEKPPRSFEVRWLGDYFQAGSYSRTTSTSATVLITKEVADIIRGV